MGDTTASYLLEMSDLMAGINTELALHIFVLSTKLKKKIDDIDISAEFGKTDENDV